MPKGNFLAPMPFMGTPADFMLDGRMPMRTRSVQPPAEDPMADAATPLSSLAQNTPDNMGGTQVSPASSQAPMAPPPYMGIQQSAPMPSMEPRGPMSTGDQLKSWMGRPETGKALMSFAAGMLSGNGFNDGLARGLSGYQQTIDAEEAKRGLTPAQIQELALKARIAQMGSRGTTANKVSSVKQGYDAEGNGVLVRVMQDGTLAHQVAGSNGWTPGLPDGYQDSATGIQKWTNKATAAANESAIEEAIGANSRIEAIDQMIAAYDKSGAGPGVFKMLQRESAKFLGEDFIGQVLGGTVDLTDLNMLEQRIYDLNLKQAQTQRGLGQLTEGERALIAQSLPGLSTDREAFMTVMNTLKGAQLRAKKLYRDWEAMPPEQRKEYGNDIRRYQLAYVEALGEGFNAPGSPAPQSTDIDAATQQALDMYRNR